MNRQNLHKYQERAVDFIIEHKSAALFLQMGLGKSVITLTAISDLLDNIEIEKVLVVAPKKVAESTWAQEAQSWEHLRHLRTSVILGTPKQRDIALHTDADVYITSRDLVVDVLEKAANEKIVFDMLVLDELTSFKSSKSKRFKAVRKARPFIRRVVGLTGTPTPNGLVDLWAQMYCIDMGMCLGRSKTKFVDAFFDTITHQGIVIKCTPKFGAEKDIYKKLEPVALTMKAEDYLELPPLIEKTIKVIPTVPTLNRYTEFERENVLLYHDAIQDQPQNIVASSAAALCNKLCQFANGAIYNEEHLPIWIHDEKIDMLMELIESSLASGSGVLVFYQFQHDCHRIMERKELKGLRVRKYEGDADLQAWNKGEIDVLLTHAASTAYGLNLQKGGHVVIWYGTGWNAELYLQGNARLHRQGQREPVIVYRLIVGQTMDETALKAIESKISTQEAMLSALKEKARKYIEQK